MSDDRALKIDTKLIHAGEIRPRIMGAVNLPIFQTAMYEYEGAAAYHDLKYIRLNNSPNHIALDRKFAALENAEAGLVTGSGMAAITTTILALLAPGSRLLAQNPSTAGRTSFLPGICPLRHRP